MKSTKKSLATKKHIEDTFIELLDEKPLKEIGIKELSAAAGINRNTFYYYFKNIPDLIESITKDYVNDILAEHPPTYNSYDDCLIAAIKLAESSKKSIYHIYNSTSRSIFERYLWKICDYTITSYINSFSRTTPMPPEKKELITAILKYTCFGFVMDWIMKGMPDGVSSKVHLLSSSIRHQLAHIESK